MPLDPQVIADLSGPRSSARFHGSLQGRTPRACRALEWRAGRPGRRPPSRGGRMTGGEIRVKFPITGSFWTG